MLIYIYIYIPVALRAISATVPTSFFVLCSLFFVLRSTRLKENKPTKQQQLPKTASKIDRKS